jgi:hypothetical protein
VKGLSDYGPARKRDIFLPWWPALIPFNLNFMLALTRVLHDAQKFRDFPNEKLTIDIQLQAFDAVKNDVEELGLLNSFDQVERIIGRFKDARPVHSNEYAEMLQALLERLIDETGRQQFFMIPSHKLQYYKGARDIFGERVNKAFGAAQKDIEHAAKCYAFGANTAVIFHLMRVMEVGLRAVGKSLNEPSLDLKRNPTWETILRRCDDELKHPLKDRSPEWSSNGQFYCDTTANLRAVKDAWRNPTMHVERDYDEDEALSVFNAVKGFMRHISTKLCEQV